MMQELRVYAIDQNECMDFTGDLTNEQFIDIAEQFGTIFSLGGFERAFNKEEIPSNWAIRFILVDCPEVKNTSWVEFLAK